MAVSRDIRTLWVTNYDKSIGDVLEFIASSAGFAPFADDEYEGGVFEGNRSLVTGVHEITKAGQFWVGGSKFWGEDGVTLGESCPIEAYINTTLSAGATTITLDMPGSNEIFDGASSYNVGYLLIENEIMSYTGTDPLTPWQDITGVTRGVFNTEAVEHVASLGSELSVFPYLPGSVQTIEYDPEDEVYAVGVAMGYLADFINPTPAIGNRQWEILEYRIFRFEFSKHVVDLVVYDEEEYAATIEGWIAGFDPN